MDSLMISGLAPPPLWPIEREHVKSVALANNVIDFICLTMSHKESVRNSQLCTVKDFLDSSTVGFKQKMFIRSLWASDDLERASDWAVIFQNV